MRNGMGKLPAPSFCAPVWPSVRHYPDICFTALLVDRLKARARPFFGWYKEEAEWANSIEGPEKIGIPSKTATGWTKVKN